MTTTTTLTPTNKQTAAQLLSQWGTYLFTQVMMELVFHLHKKLQGEIKGIPKFTCQTAYRGINSWRHTKNYRLASNLL
jgi:hypothetical protein